AILCEVDAVASAIPHQELAVQWDAAHEVQNLDGGRPHWFADQEDGIIERLTRLGNHIPGEIELGYHLCYGSYAQKHFIEPTDMGTMVRVSNGIARGLSRRMNWLHMPVPRDRDDSAYFAPLADLKLPKESMLYLGLLHLTDGVEGAKKRIGTA